jgi:hypoxanthine phosphoribosyltransferase
VAKPPMKKLVFISHAAYERRVAIVLKKWIEKTFGRDKCSVFVSSDPSDIVAGEEWLPKILQNLKRCALLITLYSPRSRRRSWVHCEAGCAWVRGTPIIPVCHSGLDIADLEMPIATKQGLLADNKRFPASFFAAVGKHLNIACRGRVNHDVFHTELRRAISRCVRLLEGAVEWPRILEEADALLRHLRTSFCHIDYVISFNSGGMILADLLGSACRADGVIEGDVRILTLQLARQNGRGQQHLVEIIHEDLSTVMFKHLLQDGAQVLLVDDFVTRGASIKKVHRYLVQQVGVSRDNLHTAVLGRRKGVNLSCVDYRGGITYSDNLVLPYGRTGRSWECLSSSARARQ